MKTYYIIGILSLLPYFTKAQNKFIKVEQNKVEQLMQDTIAFRTLEKRFIHRDTTLNAEDFITYYHAFSHTDRFLNIDKLAEMTVCMEVTTLISQKAYKEAFRIVNENLQNNPLNLQFLTLALTTGRQAGKSKDELKPYIYFFTQTLKVIANSGNGTSKATAFHVNTISDEYVFMDYILQIPRKNIKTQSLLKEDDGTHYDLFEVVPSAHFKNDFLYFNIHGKDGDNRNKLQEKQPDADSAQ